MLQNRQLTKLNEIIGRQIAFQATMNTTFEVMWLAAVEEMGEAVASTGYHDWKQSERDQGNLEIELIDIAVFVINLSHYGGRRINYRDIVNQDLSIRDNDYGLFRELNKSIVLEDWTRAFFTIFSSYPELIDVLVAKQALNKLRQDYGYATGEYLKDWNGKEDNYFLSGLYGKDYDTVYNKMEEVYVTKIIPGRLIVAD